MNLLNAMAVYAAEADRNIVLAPTGFPTGLSANSLINGLISLVVIVAGLIFFFILVFGGIRWITSQGDEAKVKEARDQVTNALIGLVVVFAAWAILKLVETLFGINLTNFTITKFVPE